MENTAINENTKTVRDLFEHAIEMSDATIAQLCARALCGDDDALAEALCFADGLIDTMDAIERGEIA